jgi:2-aminoethylphosphonate-pyruvate transaminase
MDETISPPRDRLLFTPGPLTTSLTVKQAMLRDPGSRDADFIALVVSIRQRLLDLAEVSPSVFTTVLMPGSGTYSIEAVVTTAVPPDGRILVCVNGAYGERIVRIAEVARIPTTVIRSAEDATPDPVEVGGALAADPSISQVAIVHCETSTGILNPVEAIGRVVRDHDRQLIVDAMSSFGAVPLDIEAAGVDYLVSSANKCIEGVPGFAFTVARRSSLIATKGQARSVSHDLFAQWDGLETDGQFRFTPPTHALLAFDQALTELADEGGVPGRAARYAANHRALVEGMRGLSFREYLPPEKQSHIITSFHYPTHAGFSFEDFYERLSDRGFVIYPGKLSKVDCFRIGTIGRIFEADVRRLIDAIGETLADMGCPNGA